MSREVRARIFDAFYTTKGSSSKGLGRWISKEIIEKHGGILRVRSSDVPGCSGTVFSLFLPRDITLHPSALEAPPTHETQSLAF